MMPHDPVVKHEDKLDQTKEQLCKVEEERDRAFNELIQVRKMAEEANSRIDVALAAKNLSELLTGLNSSATDATSNEVRKIAEESNSRIDVALTTNNLTEPQAGLNPSATDHATSDEVRKMIEKVDIALASKKLSEPQTGLNSSATDTMSNEVRKMTEQANSSVGTAIAANNVSEPKTGLDSSAKEATSNEVRKMTKEANSKVDVETRLKSSTNDAISNVVRKMAEEANSKVDVTQSDSSAKDATSNMEEQEDMKENNNTEALNLETNKEFELRLAEKQALLDEMKKEMDNVRACEADAMGLLNDCKRRIHELEAELDKRKASEANLYDSLAMQTKQVELNKILLEESKLEIASLRGKVEALQGSASYNTKIPDEPQASLSMKETEEGQGGQAIIEKMLKDAEEEGERLDPAKAKTLLEQMSFLRNELELAIEGDENEDKAKTLLEEMSFLKNELKLATEAEENSKKAMDDLALALKEVATEANQTKEKLVLTQVELQRSKDEVEHLRVLLNRTEDTYKQLVEEMRKEAERNNNTAERLRLEAEESLLAWNTETTEFVNCIKRSEEERAAAQEESNRLLELLKEAEDKTLASKEENQKLRDILKQALNEANVAKEAAGIAQTENSQLKDILAVRDEALKMVTQENEMLRIHEAAAFENIKELKKMLAEAPIRELKNIEEEKSSTKEASKEDKEAGKKAKAKEADKEHKEGKSLSKTISFNLKDIIAPHKQHKEGTEETNRETDDDDLKGSIFDAIGSTADSGTPSLDGDMMSSDEIDESQLDDAENNSRKRKALLRRFGDLIRRKSNPKKEPSISNEERISTTPPHNL